MIEKPYLLFLGDADNLLSAKTAAGVAYWRPEDCVGQLRLAGCRTDLGLPEPGIAAAVAQGAKTLLLGVANAGGVIPDDWRQTLDAALEAGLDIASGMHTRLNDMPALRERAGRLGRRLHDVRHPPPGLQLAVGNGHKRGGLRLLTVGTDCSVGKMYTTLALERELRARGVDADFRATGQTGILIAGDGISIDAVVADFISGAVERLAPAAEPGHWDLIEGQGSLFHPSFAGVSMGLLHGAQADALVLCDEPGRQGMRGLPHYQPPALDVCMALNLQVARRTNPAARFVGVSLNTSALDDDAAARALAETAERLELPCVDPVRTGVGPIADGLLA